MTDRTPVLELRNVSTHYGLVAVLREVDMQIYEGEMVCLLGGNASRKSTTLKTILGYVVPSERARWCSRAPISGLPTSEIVRRGISMVPENRRLFADMTVDENLVLGAYLRNDKEAIARDQEQVLETFPASASGSSRRRARSPAASRQMVAMGRALMADPKVLMDEPSMGLAPVLVEQVFEIIQTIRELGRTVFVVEQNANMALRIADRGYVIQTGEVVLADTAEALLNNPRCARRTWAALRACRCPSWTPTSSPSSTPMRAAIDALEAAFRDGDPSATPLRSHVATLAEDPVADARGGEPGVGVKLVTLTEANPDRGLPLIHAIYAMFDPVTQAPRMLVDGSALAALRTGAVSGLATRHIAPTRRGS